MSDLPASRDAIADSSGKAVIRISCLRAHTRWTITNVGVQSTSTVKIPTFKLYRNGESASGFIAGTYSAQFSNGGGSSINVNNGETLVGVFENADVGARCTMTLDGEMR